MGRRDGDSRQISRYSVAPNGGLVLGLARLVSFAQTGTEHYRGAAAVRIGVGFLALATMLGIWGLSLLVSATRLALSNQAVSASPRGHISKPSIITSFACLLVATIAFFPPWHIGRSAALRPSTANG